MATVGTISQIQIGEDSYDIVAAGGSAELFKETDGSGTDIESIDIGVLDTYNGSISEMFIAGDEAQSSTGISMYTTDGSDLSSNFIMNPEVIEWSTLDNSNTLTTTLTLTPGFVDLIAADANNVNSSVISIDSDSISFETIAQLVISGNIINLYGSDYDISNSDKFRTALKTGYSWYGTCSSTDASTAAKVVTCANYKLHTGNIITILFTYANTAAAPTLNINSTNAKSIYVNGAVASASNPCRWPANTLVTFVYDGTYYRHIGQRHYGYTYYGTCSSTSYTLAVTCAEFELQTGAIIAVQMTVNNTNTASTKTLNVNSSGAKTVYKDNAATSSSNTLTWSAGEILQFIYDGTYWRFLSRSSAEAGSSGASQIEVSTTTPTDSNIMIWIDPSANSLPAAAGVSF